MASEPDGITATGSLASPSARVITAPLPNCFSNIPIAERTARSLSETPIVFTVLLFPTAASCGGRSNPIAKPVPRGNVLFSSVSGVAAGGGGVAAVGGGARRPADVITAPRGAWTPLAGLM